MSNMVHCQLWMGSLEPYMTETFILTAFRKMGENPMSVKIMRNKFTGETAGYCFVHFANDEEAINAMHKLNGKPIPNTSPMIRFRLNNASNTGRSLMDREFSVWVGDLSSDVDDYNLYRVFSSKYNTIKTAKVILDNSGFSKGYGFVRFGSDEEMRDSLLNMNGYIGLGTKALKLSNAVPKPKGLSTPGTNNSNGSNSTNPNSTTTEFGQYYDPSTYWQNYATWQSQGYYEQPEQQIVHHDNTQLFAEKKEDDLDLIEHSMPLDIDKLNRDKIDADCNLWDALESSKWLPYDIFEVA